MWSYGKNDGLYLLSKERLFHGSDFEKKGEKMKLYGMPETKRPTQAECPSSYSFQDEIFGTPSAHPLLGKETETTATATVAEENSWSKFFSPLVFVILLTLVIILKN